MTLPEVDSKTLGGWLGKLPESWTPTNSVGDKLRVVDGDFWWSSDDEDKQSPEHDCTALMILDGYLDLRLAEMGIYCRPYCCGNWRCEGEKEYQFANHPTLAKVLAVKEIHAKESP